MRPNREFSLARPRVGRRTLDRGLLLLLLPLGAGGLLSSSLLSLVKRGNVFCLLSFVTAPQYG